MHFVDQFYAWLRGDLDGEINHDRQYRLMKIVGIELIILGFCIIYVYILCGLWIIVVLISILNLIGFLNLYLLYRTKNSLRCGHILTTSILVAAVFANLCVGGVDSSYFVWFHVTPVIAAIAVGRTGLIIYSAITFVMIIFCAMVIVQPLYSIDNTYKFSLDLINYLFSLLIIVTALFNMLRENAYYERLLYERNYMLQADKEKFHHLSRYDTLTNLPNRAYFQTTLESRIETISRDDCLTVFFMDLDGFKLVNDYYGHETGDELLLQTAKRLQECFREGDFLARLGGDEFTAVIIHHKDEKTPRQISLRILQEFNHVFKIDLHEINCTISIGLATYPIDSIRADELVAKADLAMYSAKKSGGNTYMDAAQQVGTIMNSPG